MIYTASIDEMFSSSEKIHIMLSNEDILAYLEQMEWSQADLARQIKLDVDKVNKSLKGARRWRPEEMEAIKRVLGMATIDLKTTIVAIDKVFDTIENDSASIDRDTFKRLVAFLLTEFSTSSEITLNGDGALRSILNFEKSKKFIEP